MNKKLLFTLLISALSLQFSFAQWSIGDIAFTGYQSDGVGNPSGEDDQFSFVLFRDVSTNETISFTDNGWLSAGGFRPNETTITLTFTSDYFCGDQISIANAPFAAVDENGTSAGTLAGSALSFAIGGDQIFAYDPANVPSAADDSGFIAAIQMNGDWDADATSSSTSARPPAFVSSGVTADIAISPEVDNAIYDCSTANANASLLRAEIINPANWNTNNTTPFDQPAPCDLGCAPLSNESFGDSDVFGIFPNPSNGDVIIRNSGIPLNSATVTDINGRTIATYQLGGGIQDKNLSLNLKTGIYFIKLTSDKVSTTKKIVIK